MKKLLSILMAMLLLFSCAAAEIIVDIGPVTSAAVVGCPTAAPDADAGVSPAPDVSPSPEPTAMPRLHGLKIGIDPGHQAKANREFEPVAPGSDETKYKVSSGTAGVSTGVAEYIVNLDIALQLRDALEALGCTVYMTRDVHEIDISNLERAMMMNELNVDLVLRLHCDGADDESANGIGKPVCFLLGQELCRIHTFSQKTNIIGIIVPLSHIEALFAFIIDNEFFIIVVFQCLLCIFNCNS